MGLIITRKRTWVSYTDTINFIPKHEVPNGKDVTYATYVLDYRPLKSEPYRVKITVDGDRLTYDNDADDKPGHIAKGVMCILHTQGGT